MYSVIFVLLKNVSSHCRGGPLEAFLLKVEQFCNIYIFISLFYFILKTSLFRVLLFTRERKTRSKQAVGA